MMKQIRDLARELKLTDVSVRTHCRTRDIDTVRRLPRGASGGQMTAHVSDEDADRIRAHYADRLLRVG